MHILRQKIIWDAKVEMLFVHSFLSMCKCVSEMHSSDKGYTKILNVDPISVSGTPISVSGTPISVSGTPNSVSGTPNSISGTSKKARGSPKDS